MISEHFLGVARHPNQINKTKTIEQTNDSNLNRSLNGIGEELNSCGGTYLFNMALNISVVSAKTSEMLFTIDRKDKES